MSGVMKLFIKHFQIYFDAHIYHIGEIITCFIQDKLTCLCRKLFYPFISSYYHDVMSSIGLHFFLMQ